MRTHVFFEAEPGVMIVDGDITIESVLLDDLVERAVDAARSADRIELCGGMDVTDVDRVFRAVGAEADVRSNRYGFESLEQVAAYKRAFADGDAADAAFFYRGTASAPLAQHPGVLVAAAADDDALAELAREAHQRGAGIIELYGGLGAHGAAIVRAAVAHAVPVGYVD
jgi:hypothetical protein